MYYVQLTNGIEIISDKPFHYAPDGTLMNGNAMFWKGNEPVQYLSFKKDNVLLSWATGINVINDFPEAIREEKVKETVKENPLFPSSTNGWSHVGPNPGERFKFGASSKKENWKGELLEDWKKDSFTAYYCSIKLFNNPYREEHKLSPISEKDKLMYKPFAVMPKDYAKNTGVTTYETMPVFTKDNLPF
jgi:hypothetical protein